MERWSKLRNRLLAFVAMIAAAAPIVRAADAQDPGEDEVWQRTQRMGTAAAYEAYLQQFPLGKYTREAYRSAVVLAVREQSPDFEVITPPGWGFGQIPGEDAAIATPSPPSDIQPVGAY